MDYIIKVENLGKKYRIRHQQDGQRYVAMRDVIAALLRDSRDVMLSLWYRDQACNLVRRCLKFSSAVGLLLRRDLA
jgi:hypothetical protein